jgi:hypothetical protein
MKVLVMGPPKSGKTSFIATAPNVVVADVEAGLMSIAHLNIPYVTIDEVSKLETLYQILKDENLRQRAAQQMGLPSIDTVAIDTLDAFQEMLKKDILATERRSEMQQKDWGKLKERMFQILKAFKSLPMNVIFTCHTSTTQDEEGKQIYAPNLQGSIKDEIAGLVDFSLMSGRDKQVQTDGTSEIVYFLKNEGDAKNPHLGNRGAGRIPEISEPDFMKLFEATFSGIKQLPKTTVFDVESTPTQAPVAAPAPSQPAEPAPQAPADDADHPLNTSGQTVVTKSYKDWNLNAPDFGGWTMAQGREVARAFTNAKTVAVTKDPDTAREGLVEWLQTHNVYFGAEGEEPPQPEPVEEVTSEADQADEAQATVEQELGGQVVYEKITAEATCDGCGNQVDDVEIANLSKTRYGKVLCVKDYMAETRK